MTSRKWAGSIGVAGCIVVLGLYCCITVLERSESIKRAVISAFSVSTGGEFSFENLKIGFLSVYLQNVKISLAMHFFSMRVRDIKVVFSPWKLIKTRGNIVKSIRDIVLMAPELDVYAAAGTAVETPLTSPPVNSGALLSAFKGFPVDHFTIRKGVVRTMSAAGLVLAAAEDLSGNLKDEDDGVLFDVRGKVVSNKKNLYVSGFFSKRRGRNRLSIRLYKTTLKKPVRWREFALRDGVLEGVCEMSFPDSITAETVESNGWIHIAGGSAAMENTPITVTDLDLSIGLDKTLWRIDTLSCRFGGVALRGKGAWDLARPRAAHGAITLQCQDIKPETLFPKMPRGFYAALRGPIWANATLSESGGLGAALKLDAGGMSLYDVPLRLAARAELFIDHVAVDTCEVDGPALNAGFSGTLDFKKSPVAYWAGFSLRADTMVGPLKGFERVRAQGSISGLGKDVRYEAEIRAAGVKVFGRTLAYPEITLTGGESNRVTFTGSLKDDPVFFSSGAVDNILSKTPKISASITLDKNTLFALAGAAAAPIAGKIDSALAHAFFQGSADTFTLRGDVSLASTLARGKVSILAEKPRKRDIVRWKMASKTLFVGDSLMSFGAAGTIDERNFTIDTLLIPGGIRGFGHVDFGPAQTSEFELKYHDLPLCALNAWVFRRGAPLKSGTVSGNTRISGMHGRINTESYFHVRRCAVGPLTDLETEAVCKTHDSVFIVSPLTIEKDGVKFMSIDTLSNACATLLSGHFNAVSIGFIIAGIAPEEYYSGDLAIKGLVSGTLRAPCGGFPMTATFHCARASMGAWNLDSLKADLSIVKKGVIVKQFSAQDGARVRLSATGTIPWAVFSNKTGPNEAGGQQDSLSLSLSAKGDLLSSIEKNLSDHFNLPIKGSAQGTVEVGLGGVAGSLRLTKALCRIPKGTISVKPYIQETINDFSATMNLEARDSASDDESMTISLAPVSFDISATINKRPIRVISCHKVPAGFEPIKIGFLDAGVLHVSTPKHGIDVHVPGLMEPGVEGDVEFGPAGPLSAFTLSGPVDKLRISGAWTIRGGDFTFPPLVNAETAVPFDPFPYITWDLDLRAGNRKIKYFYDAGTNRRLVRLVECYLDPVSFLSLRGRDKDATFKILGSIRSTKGTVYFRRTFDRNFDAGLDFIPKPLPSKKGFDNMPIIWGSAEAVSENNRLDRVKLTLVTRDSITNAFSEKGRFYDIRFRMSTDAETMPGDTALNFFTEEGKKMGSVEGAGGFVSSLGEQYLHRYLLQNFEERLAKRLGLDVINVETSIASNYFNKLYNRQFFSLANEWNYLAFANVGITVGRYILYDKVFLKWRTELVPVDTLLAPEYTMGFEFQPLSFFMMDVNYGVRQEGRSLEYNPQLIMQLRLPIDNIRKYFKF
jgi:hypothetical protein